MRGSLKLHLLSSLVLPPVIVAAVLTMVAIKLFRSDKELYVYDLSAQSVELVARNLTATLESLTARAALERDRPSPPLLSVQRRSAAEVGVEAGGFQIQNRSRPGDARLEIQTRRGETGFSIEIRPETLVDLRGFVGLTNLIVVNDQGRVLVHPDHAQVEGKRELHDLVVRLGVFSRSGMRVGTRALDLDGVPTLVAHARAGSHLAVLQTIARKDVFAAADPLITSAALASGAVVLVAVLLALLLGRSVIRPLRAMAEQAEAIGRGEWSAGSGAVAGAGEVAKLQESLNGMGASLKKREQELRQVQQQLLQAERLNTAGRMVSSIVKELSAPLESCFSLAGTTLKGLAPASELRALQEQILAETDRAANILQNLSRVSARDEAGVREVELDMVVADVLISAGPLLEGRRLSVETDLSMPVGRVQVSPDQLRNALLDIFLFVAQEAIASSGVLVSVWRRAAEAVVSIQFRGEPVVRQASTIAADGKGALVLAVASSVIEDEGGRLTVESLDAGSRINVSLPLLATPD